MKLNYAGPKAMVSHTGVTFDQKKRDKYHYLQFAVHLIKALDHDYLEGRSYSFEPRNDLYPDEELRHTIAAYCPEADRKAKRRYEKKAAFLDSEIAAAEHHPLLNDEERTVLVNNLRLMRNYRLQRSINKSYYYSTIYALTAMIAHKRIRYIQAPFGHDCYHVFHSIEGAARHMKFSIAMRIEIFHDKDELMIKLHCAGR